MTAFAKYWLPPILWAAVIYLFSGERFSSDNTSPLFLPFIHWLFPEATPELMDSCHFFIRKSGHFAEYFVLSILLYRAFLRGHGPLWKWRVAVWTLGVVLLYSVADEVRQTFAPNRSGVWSDSVLDFFGGSCAVGLLYARHRRKAGARSPVAVTDPYAN